MYAGPLRIAIETETSVTIYRFPRASSRPAADGMVTSVQQVMQHCVNFFFLSSRKKPPDTFQRKRSVTGTASRPFPNTSISYMMKR